MERDGNASPYSELLGLARDDGLIGLDVQVTQAPGEANGRTAVVVAVARTSDSAFSAVGEASPASAPSAWHPFLTTLAELRAKARALRDLTGQGIAVQEELDVPYRPADDDDDEGEAEREPARGRPITAAHDAPSGYQAARQPSPTAGSYNATSATPTPARPAGVASAASTPAEVEARLQRLRIAAQPQAAPRRPTEDESEGDENEGDEAAPPPPRYTPPSTASAASVTPAAPPVPRPDPFQTVPSNADEEDENEDEEEGEPDDGDEARDEDVEDSIDDDMRAKLMKLAISLAKLNGKDVTDAEAVQRLDAYFMRAFKRPLNRATRHEGQMAVSSLSKQLQTRRNAGGE